MLIPTKNGTLWVRASTGTQTAAIDLAPRMCTNGERALGGVAIHPNFASTHFIYLYYTFNKFGTCNESEIDGPVNRLSRFVLRDDNTVDPASETVILDTAPLFKDHHNGGDLWFATDGFLYATVGDGGSASLNWPQNLGLLFGKVVRLTDTGGIPAGNPFTGAGTARCNVEGKPPAGSPTGTKCQEIYAYGLRNPFRFAFDPNASGVRFFINDVGQHSWEEIDEGALGANYGWPEREGPCVKDSTTDCGPPPAGMTNPIYAYEHTPVNGGAATGGAFVPNGLWGTAYDGAYMFADYANGRMYKLAPDGSGGWTRSDFGAANAVVSLRFHDNGLYVITRDSSEIRKITFNGVANRAPTAQATATPHAGALPLAVNFDGSASIDLDGDALTYTWDFGDGSAPGFGATTAHTYTAAGTFTATLTVSDGRGGSDSTTLRIDAGNRAPTPVIETPVVGAEYAVGQSFTLRGSATDPEDGALPTSSLKWRIDKHHNTHTHPFLDPTSGNDLTFFYPEPEDLDAARTSFLRVYLTATDNSGVSTTQTIDLLPRKVDVTFATDPTGLNLNVSGVTITGPTTVTSWQNFTLTANAPNQTSGTDSWRYSSWSDGGAQSHPIVTGSTPASYTANFIREGVAMTSTFEPIADSRVNSGSVNSNYGTSSRLQAGGTYRSYLRFNLAGLAPTIRSAKLRLYTVTAGPSINGHPVSDTSWGETTITHANAPPMGSSIGSSPAFSVAEWVEVDVTPAVLGNGLLTLGVTSPSPTTLTFNSRDSSSNRPQLVVTHVSGPPNTAPTARASATPRSGLAPLSVVFDGSTSTDPDGDSLSYSWNFGDGSPAGSGAMTNHTYTADGHYTATLTVNDGKGGTASANVDIHVGNQAPTAVIDSPAASTPFGVGDSFVLRGTATDAEDGTLSDAALSWTVVRRRGATSQPFHGPVSGNSIALTYPAPETLDAAQDTYLEVRLTATDSQGTSATVTRNLLPKKVDLTFQTSGPGLRLNVWDKTITGPTTVTSWQNLSLPVNAPNQTDTAGATWTFASWSDAGAQSHTIITGAAPATYTATYTPSGTPYASTSFTPIADARVNSGSLDSNYGTSSSLRAGGSYRSYLKFDLSGLGAPIRKAWLRLYPGPPSVDARSVADTSWGETTITGRNAPAMGPIVGSSGPVANTDGTEIDVTSLITGNGLLTIGTTSTSATSIQFNSRESSSSKPTLVVTTGTGNDNVPPTTPANFTATLVNGGRVDLAWGGSTDEMAVQGYRIYRNGVALSPLGPGARSYSDTNVLPDTPYTYYVVALDSANESAPSPSRSVRTPCAGCVAYTLTAVADARIDGGAPSTNYGTSSRLKIDTSPDVKSLLRFDLNGITGTLVSARLSLFTASAHSLGYDVRGVADTTWNEATVTYATAPLIGSIGASAGPFASGVWAEADVTSLTALNRLVSMAISGKNGTSAQLYSKENSSNRPQLVVQVRP